MKVTLDTNYDVKGLDFCCSQMADMILRQQISPLLWSDHIPRFEVNFKNEKAKRIFIDFCPRCGAKITGKIE